MKYIHYDTRYLDINFFSITYRDRSLLDGDMWYRHTECNRPIRRVDELPRLIALPFVGNVKIRFVYAADKIERMK